MRVAILSLCLAAFPILAQVSVVLGTGEPGLSATQVNNPYGLVTGPDGALYFAEATNNVVRRLDLKTKAISIVAGTGKAGYSGDGGPAAQAQLQTPHEIRFDAAGNIFIADTFNHVVRRIEAKTRIISTVAGTGKQGFGGDGASGAQAQLNQPHSIVIDREGHLLICDTGNHRLRRVDLRTGVITTIGGTGEKQPTPDGAPLAGTPLFGPRTLAVGPGGELYLALREGNQIFRIEPKQTRLTWLAGTGAKGYSGDGGPATKATLNGPKGLAVAGSSLYISDTESHVIRRLDLKSGQIDTVLGGGTRGGTFSEAPRKCELNRPHGVFAASEGRVYVGDSENHRILLLDLLKP